jgi:hypothetical protein
MYLAIYFLLVVVIQFMVNASIISTTCGGSVTENMGAAGVFTFLPWTLIFGVLIVILTVYPGFKSAFSDVVGYFWVSSSANKIITDLLINPDIQTKMDTDAASTPEQKEAMQGAADAIIKICGNTAILINQIVPSNFDSYWNILKPLMKGKYQTENEETNKIKNDLFNAETKKCPEPTAGSQIFRVLMILLASFRSSILSYKSSKSVQFQFLASLNFCTTALRMVSLHIYIVMKPGVKNDPSL